MQVRTMPLNSNSTFETQLEKQKQEFNSASVNGPNSLPNLKCYIHEMICIYVS
jgi:hypothetical protein